MRVSMTKRVHQIDVTHPLFEINNVVLLNEHLAYLVALANNIDTIGGVRHLHALKIVILNGSILLNSHIVDTYSTGRWNQFHLSDSNILTYKHQTLISSTIGKLFNIFIC